MKKICVIIGTVILCYFVASIGLGLHFFKEERFERSYDYLTQTIEDVEDLSDSIVESWTWLAENDNHVYVAPTNSSDTDDDDVDHEEVFYSSIINSYVSSTGVNTVTVNDYLTEKCKDNNVDATYKNKYSYLKVLENAIEIPVVGAFATILEINDNLENTKVLIDKLNTSDDRTSILTELYDNITYQMDNYINFEDMPTNISLLVLYTRNEIFKLNNETLIEQSLEFFEEREW